MINKYRILKRNNENHENFNKRYAALIWRVMNFEQPFKFKKPSPTATLSRVNEQPVDTVFEPSRGSPFLQFP